ncbi:MAG: neutral/alkaline non-lysosomal ceramidase N-terminal domain-containing protein [Propionibacteriaceae bacterium]
MGDGGDTGWGPHVVSAGAATVVVDVPSGTPMSGYAARTAGSNGVHDPLTVRALVIDDVGIVVIDCVALRKTTCGELRAARPAGLIDVVIAATHTHSGPCLTPGGLGGFSPGVLHAVERAFVEALTAARHARTPVTVRYGTRRDVGVGSNRRHHDRAIDPPVQVLSFDSGHGTVATLVTYPMHPVVLSAANTLISADYVGPLRDAIEAALPGSVCLFAQGCAGDVNDDVHTAEGDFSSAPAPGRTFEDAQVKGRAVASAALEALAGATVLPGRRTEISTSTVALDITRLDPGRVAADAESWRTLATTLPPEQRDLYRIWADWAADWLTHPHPAEHWLARVGVISVGGLPIVTLPGEPFLAVADRIRDGLGDALVLGYCDGVSGYLPTADEYAFGGYEVVAAHRYYGMPGPYAPGSAERLADAALALAPEAERSKLA